MYLSVDLDYWNADSATLIQMEQCLRFLLESSKKSDVPAMVCMNHQQLLNHVNRSRARTLINVDWHGDVCESDVTELNCGTWVSYVRWRHAGRYIWYRPQKDATTGACNNLNMQFCTKGYTWRSRTDWKKVTGRQVTSDKLLSKLRVLMETYELTGLGFSLSPTFTVEASLKLGKALFQEYEVPYRRGRVDEHYGRKCAPSRRLP